MPPTSFKVSFTLDDQDVAYFRSLFRKAKAAAREASREQILAGARELIANVRRTKKTPKFVVSAVEAIEDLVAIIEDADYRAPKSVADQVLAALAYFTDPEDLIPDNVPVLGFLDDAIMIKFIEREFRHELAGYRKFKRFRGGAEQRPWTKIARERLPDRLESMRTKLREQIERRRSADAARGLTGF